MPFDAVLYDKITEDFHSSSLAVELAASLHKSPIHGKRIAYWSGKLPPTDFLLHPLSASLILELYSAACQAWHEQRNKPMPKSLANEAWNRAVYDAWATIRLHVFCGSDEFPPHWSH